MPKEPPSEVFTYKTVDNKEVAQQFDLERILNDLKMKYSKVIKQVDLTSVKNAIKVTYWKDDSVAAGGGIEWNDVR